MICIYHSRDLDGWCSAAIVMKWYKETNPNGVIYDNPYQGDKSIVSGKEKEESLTMFGWDYGNELPNLNRYKKVIMVDISFPKEEMSKLYHMLDVSFIWIDHHISAIKENDDLAYDGLRDTKHAACELTWKHFFPNENMPEFVRLLGRYDCFGHKGTDEEENVLLFQYAARAKYFDFKSCY
jgi:oligoribonuclease NrnB/cAMP/cGMP phosphodiesterase (DHH superfamily)